jgi:hypothetical protein
MPSLEKNLMMLKVKAAFLIKISNNFLGLGEKMELS